MKKNIVTIRYLLIIVLLTFSVVIDQSISFAEDAPKIIEKLYLKNGNTIKYSICWEGQKCQILCMKSVNINLYSADEVNLVKTFGETNGKKISVKHEKLKRIKALMSSSRIVSPEEEEAMKIRKFEKNQKIASELKAYGITSEQIAVEKRALRKWKEFDLLIRLEKDPALYFLTKDDEKYRKEMEYYKKKIESLENIIDKKMEEELDAFKEFLENYDRCLKSWLKKGRKFSYCKRKCSRYKYR